MLLGGSAIITLQFPEPSDSANLSTRAASGRDSWVATVMVGLDRVLPDFIRD